MNKLQINGKLYHVHGLTELKDHTYIFNAIYIKTPINTLHREENNLIIHRKAQKTKATISQQNKL